MRHIVSNLRPDAALDGVAPLSTQVARSVAQPRFAAVVLLAFAGLALLLAAVGLYGVLSYTVASRRREIGIRSALGASRAALMSMVLREGVMVAIFGLVVGLAGAAALTRLMQSMLVGIEPLDPLSFALAGSMLAIVSLVTCALPARAAAATDPAIMLRSD